MSIEVCELVRPFIDSSSVAEIGRIFGRGAVDRLRSVGHIAETPAGALLSETARRALRDGDLASLIETVGLEPFEPDTRQELFGLWGPPMEMRKALLENAGRRWTSSQTRELAKQLAQGLPYAAVAADCRRTVVAIGKRVHVLGLCRMPRWSTWENRVLTRGVAAGRSNAVIASALPNRTVKAVKLHARALVLPARGPRRWTAGDAASLCATHADGGDVAAWAKAHGRTLRAVEGKLSELGLRFRSDLYSKQDINRIRAGYARRERVARIAAAIGRSEGCVRGKAQALGLSRSRGTSGKQSEVSDA